MQASLSMSGQGLASQRVCLPSVLSPPSLLPANVVKQCRSARRLGATPSLRLNSELRAEPISHPDWPVDAAKYQGLRDEDVLELESFLHAFIARSGHEDSSGPGEVHLVGTGPGDPGLLTLRAVQLMQTADVVLYDRLVSDDILRLVSPSARMVYVGKHSGFHTRTQDEIHRLLLAFAEAGACVIRLKGGDPYVFGRGGEEVQYLAAKGIQVHAVPGITAAAGICAELGIPMTHRGVATSVRFLTGHARDGGEQELVDSSVAGAADPHTTLVVYMGLQTLPSLQAQLEAHGLPPDVPAVAVERGTTRRQRVCWGSVGQLAGRAQAAGLKSPTLIIIGQVVSLAPGWSQWQAAGKPLVWNAGQPPRHGYRLPVLDTELLQQQQQQLALSAQCSTEAGEGQEVHSGRQPAHMATQQGEADSRRSYSGGIQLRSVNMHVRKL
ncbi:tetrapyrrole methylase [Haematococcus lacustris]